jgi:hypothetical protein
MVQVEMNDTGCRVDHEEGIENEAKFDNNEGRDNFSVN